MVSRRITFAAKAYMDSKSTWVVTISLSANKFITTTKIKQQKKLGEFRKNHGGNDALRMNPILIG